MAVAALPAVGFALGCGLVDQVAPAALSLGSSATNCARGLLGLEQVALAEYEPMLQFDADGCPEDAYGADLYFSRGWCGSALTACAVSTMLPLLATGTCLGMSSLAWRGTKMVGKGLLGLARG